MPYVRKGNTVYKRENGNLKKVGSSKNPKKYMRVLGMVHAGLSPRKSNA